MESKAVAAGKVGKIGKIGKKILSLRRLLGIVVFFALWETAPRANLVNANFLPPFSVVAEMFWKLLLSGELIRHIAISLRRSVVGLSLGFAV